MEYRYGKPKISSKRTAATLGKKDFPCNKASLTMKFLTLDITLKIDFLCGIEYDEDTKVQSFRYVNFCL